MSLVPIGVSACVLCDGANGASPVTRMAHAVYARDWRRSGSASAWCCWSWRCCLPWIALFATTYASYQRDHDATRASGSGTWQHRSARASTTSSRPIEGLLLAIAEAASADTASIARNDAILRRLRDELPPYITNLALWGSDGHNIGSSDADPARARKMEVAAHRFFREAHRGDSPDGRPTDREPRDAAAGA